MPGKKTKADESASRTLKKALGLEVEPETKKSTLYVDGKKLPICYYDSAGGGYWLQLGPRYLQLGPKDIALHLRHRGINPDSWTEDGFKAVDKVMIEAQLHRCVDYAGPLAGYEPKLFETASGLRVLVTKGFSFVDGKKGRCPTFQQFLEELLGEDQIEYFICWLKLRRAALRKGDIATPGQALILVGPPRCGKSFLQKLITHLLGGRGCKPKEFMTGGKFNKDLAEAEHWMMEDDCLSMRYQDRLAFGDALKDATVNAELRIRAMGRDGMMIVTFRTLSISINRVREKIAQLPPFHEGIREKIMAFMCNATTLTADYADTWKKFEAELPAFAHFVDTYQIPRRLKDKDMGILAYHHPEILEALNEMAPEEKLMELIDVIMSRPDSLFQPSKITGEYSGRADAIEGVIRSTDLKFQAEKIFPFATACGTFLGRLAEPGSPYEGRVRKTTNRGRTVWHIKPERAQVEL